MAEQTYMGYVSPITEGVDWAGLSSQLSTKLKTIETEREAEREALRQISRDNEMLVNSYTPGKDQTFNEMILKGADDARNKITYWSKELEAGRLKPKDFKTKQTNLKEYWGTLANNAKNYDQRIADSLARQQDGTAGVLEAELLRNWTDATDVKSNAVVVSDDGRVYTSKFDRATGQPTGLVSDVRLLSLPENIQSDKIDLPTQIENYISDWQPATMFAADLENKNIEVISESIKNQPNYTLMKDKVANAIAPDSNPRAQVSVLGDNGALDVNFYYTDDEYNQKYDELFSQLEADKAVLGEEITQEDINNIDLSLIRMGVDDNNMYNPILTDAQKQAVKDFISNEIDIRTEDKLTKEKSLEYQIGLEQEKLTLAQKRAAQAASRRSSGGGTSKTAQVDAEVAKQLKTVFNKKTVAAANVLTDYLQSGYKVVLLKSGDYQLQKQEDAGYAATAQAGGQIGGSQKKWVAVKTFNTFDALSPYIDYTAAKNTIKSQSQIGKGELD
jgi:hypothetical protein